MGREGVAEARAPGPEEEPAWTWPAEARGGSPLRLRSTRAELRSRVSFLAGPPGDLSPSALSFLADLRSFRPKPP